MIPNEGDMGLFHAIPGVRICPNSVQMKRGTAGCRGMTIESPTLGQCSAVEKKQQMRWKINSAKTNHVQEHHAKTLAGGHRILDNARVRFQSSSSEIADICELSMKKCSMWSMQAKTECPDGTPTQQVERIEESWAHAKPPRPPRKTTCLPRREMPAPQNLSHRNAKENLGYVSHNRRKKERTGKQRSRITYERTAHFHRSVVSGGAAKNGRTVVFVEKPRGVVLVLLCLRSCATARLVLRCATVTTIGGLICEESVSLVHGCKERPKRRKNENGGSGVKAGWKESTVRKTGGRQRKGARGGLGLRRKGEAGGGEGRY
ncbi:hypothetical protein B0H12DRAFT_1072937 [Mycena haematopus]|nr:hypothetical protein B0H12DRAFT_1072937 [Mycena haematopus]